MVNSNEKRLSAYCAEAEQLAERGSIDRAMAIGQHILRHHSKYVDAYRVLAKAALEQDEVGHAADLFKRVLSADPEDLESRVGLGIIYTGEEALEEALWQWERAFELAPGDPDIRAQLGRIRERLGDTDFSRVELTRSALGRLYARGGLFQQAADEFQVVLRQAPDRVDVQVALAETLWRDEKLATAEAVCEQILEALPNCLKANLILGQIWLHTGREEESHRPFRIAHMLDPENRVAIDLLGEQSPLTGESVFIPTLEVPAAEAAKPVDLLAIEEEQLVGEPEAEGREAKLPDWLTQLPGAGMEEGIAEEEPLPDWLDTTQLEEPMARMDAGDVPFELEPEPEGREFEEEDLPDWLSALRTGEEQEFEVPSAEAEKEPAAEEEMLDKDVPEWLRELRTEMAKDISDVGELDKPPAQLEAEAEQFASREAPRWLREVQEETDESVEAISEEETLVPRPEASELPDGVEALETKEPASAELEAVKAAETPELPREAEEIPEWLTALQPDEVAEPAVAEAEGLPEEEALEEESPDWLAILQVEEATEPAASEAEDLAEEEGFEEEIPDWLTALQAEEPVEPGVAEPFDEPEVAEAAEPAEELPDWLAALRPEEPAGPKVEEEPEGETDLWGEVMRQEGLAEMIDAVPAEAEDLVEEEGLEEEIPEWLAALQAEEPAEPEADELSGEPEVAEVAEESEVGETDLWREVMHQEGLAEMIEAMPAEAEGVAEEEGPEEEIPDWLTALQPEEPVEPPAEPEMAEPAEEIPDWLAALQPEGPAGAEVAKVPVEPEVAEAAEEPEVGETDLWREVMREEGLAEMIDAVPAEAEGLAEEEGPDEAVPEWLAALQAEEPVEPPSEPEAAEEPEVGETDLWREVMREEGLAEMIEAMPAEAEGVAEEEGPEEEIPDWLTALQLEEPVEPPAEPEVAEPAEEIPDWLAALQPEEPAGAEVAKAPVEPEVAEAAEEPEVGETDLWREVMRQEGLAEMIEAVPTEAEGVAEEEGPEEEGPEEAVPDWLTALQPEEPVEPLSEPEAAEESEVGDTDLWREVMRQEGLAEMIEAVPAEAEGVTEEEGPEEAVPDWLAALQPEEPVEPPSEPEAAEEPEVGETDLWREVMRQEGLAEMIEAVPAEAEGLAEEEGPEEAVPEWLAALQVEEPVEPPAEPEVAEPAEEIPDWLAALQPEEPVEPPSEPEAAEEPEVGETDLWREVMRQEGLAEMIEAMPAETEGLAEEEEPKEAVPEWLAALQSEEPVEPPAEPEVAEAAEEPEVGETDLWREVMRQEGLAEMIEAMPAEAEDLAEEEGPEEEIPEWLVALQSREPKEPVELEPAGEPSVEPEAAEAAAQPKDAEPEEEAVDRPPALQPKEPLVPEAVEPLAEPEMADVGESAEEPGEKEAVAKVAAKAEPAEPGVVEEAVPPAEKEAIPEWLAGWQGEAEPKAVKIEIAAEPTGPKIPRKPAVEKKEEPTSFLVSSYLSRLETHPKDYEVRLSLARAYRDEKRLSHAFEQFEMLVSSAQQVKELVPDLEGLCDSYPDDAKWHQLLGDAYMRVNRLADALKAYRAAQDAFSKR